MDALNMYRKEINKYIEQIFSQSDLFARLYRDARSTKHKIAYRLSSFITGSKIYLASPFKIYLPLDRFTRTYSYKWV